MGDSEAPKNALIALLVDAQKTGGAVASQGPGFHHWSQPVEDPQPAHGWHHPRTQPMGTEKQVLANKLALEHAAQVYAQSYTQASAQMGAPAQPPMQASPMQASAWRYPGDAMPPLRPHPSPCTTSFGTGAAHYSVNALGKQVGESPLTRSSACNGANPFEEESPKQLWEMKCIAGHTLQPCEVMDRCVLCGRVGTSFHCPAGCDFGLCQACWEKGARAIRPN